MKSFVNFLNDFSKNGKIKEKKCFTTLIEECDKELSELFINYSYKITENNPDKILKISQKDTLVMLEEKLQKVKTNNSVVVQESLQLCFENLRKFICGFGSVKDCSLISGGKLSVSLILLGLISKKTSDKEIKDLFDIHGFDCVKKLNYYFLANEKNKENLLNYFKDLEIFSIQFHEKEIKIKNESFFVFDEIKFFVKPEKLLALKQKEEYKIVKISNICTEKEYDKIISEGKHFLVYYQDLIKDNSLELQSYILPILESVFVYICTCLNISTSIVKKHNKANEEVLNLSKEIQNLKEELRQYTSEVNFLLSYSKIENKLEEFCSQKLGFSILNFEIFHTGIISVNVSCQFNDFELTDDDVKSLYDTTGNCISDYNLFAKSTPENINKINEKIKEYFPSGNVNSYQSGFHNNIPVLQKIQITFFSILDFI